MNKSIVNKEFFKTQLVTQEQLQQEYFVLQFNYIVVEIKLPHMEKKEQKKNRSNPNNQSLSYSQNQSLTHLAQQQESKQNIKMKGILNTENQNSQSGQKLFKSFQSDKNQHSRQKIVEIQSKEVFIKNIQQQKDKVNDLKPALQDVSKMHMTSFQRKKTKNQLPIIRSNTMIQSEKKYQQSSDTIRHKLPQAILQYITHQAKLKRLPSANLTKTETGKKLGQLGLSKILSMKYNTKKCQICESEVPQKQFQRMTKSCQHTYCSSCLHHYVIYKINAFQAVSCPNQGCNQPLDQQCQLYQQLPLQVRKKYKKLLQYEMVKQHPNRKMCPQEKCQGWIDINESLDPVCSACKKMFCAKCLLPYHDGDCDNKQLQFFQGTLHYRQCNKCKNVIEKSSGCIHMTCRCGYQFCYLCGAKWSHTHTCNNPQNQPLHRQEANCCCCTIDICDCDCGECCDNCLDNFCDFCCSCCDNNDGQHCSADCCDPDNCPVFACILHWFAKGLMFLLLFGGLFPMIIVCDFVFLGFFWVILTIFSGLTMYTIEIISELEGFWFVLSIIFYPFTAIGGIVLAFRQVFIEVYGEHVKQMVESMCGFIYDVVNQ